VSDPARWIVHFGDEPPVAHGLRDLIGGKGAGLVEMTRDGLPVPPGFTIAVPCCERFFALGRCWPERLETELRAAVARLEGETGRDFGGDAQRLLVSVRSGAAVSMPGMMDTLLDVGASADPWGELRAAVTAVFESFASARAVAYRRQRGLDELRGTAVTVQAMFASRVSGVLFSIDPSRPDSGCLVVEAAPGLGEAVVSGDVTPDRFLVARDGLAVVESVVESVVVARGAASAGAGVDPRSPCLDATELRELGALGLRLETRYGHPVDVEWGIADGRIALLQVRAIHGLDVARAVEPARLTEIARLRKLAASGRRVWVIHNLAETLRAPTPLTWDIVRRMMRGDGGFGRLYTRLGYRPSERVRRDGFLELIAGRIYSDPERLAELFWDGLPLAYDLDALRVDPRVLDRAPAVFRADRADGRFLRRLPANLFGIWRASRALRRKRRDAVRVFEELALPAFLRQVEASSARDLVTLDDDAVVDELESRIALVVDRFSADALEPGFCGGLAFESLTARLRLVLGDEEGFALATQLVRGLDGDTTIEQDALLWDVARSRATLGEFLARYGHRAVGEMELAEPRWREDAGAIEPLVDALRHAGRSPRELHEDNVARRLAARKELPGILREHGASALREDIERDLVDAQRLLPYRESGKHWWMLGYELLRGATQELARRWGIGRGVYFLHVGELRGFARARSAREEAIARRRVRFEAWKRLDLADVVDSACLDDVGRPRPVAHARELRGSAVAAGVGEGIVRIVDDPRRARALGARYVLVCPSTDPGWTPLFVNAAALVVERGGVLSHGAIVARDFGIPAVVCPHATRILRDGSTVRVDGSSGVILVLEEE